MAVKLFDGGMVAAVIFAPATGLSVSLLTCPNRRTCAETTGVIPTAIMQQNPAKPYVRTFLTITGAKPPCKEHNAKAEWG